jgi:NAD(P)-dependent dehydrogenase (short-subunit alcohol dehydrogenase family)
MRFEGKTVFITGATGALGTAAVQRFAAEGANIAALSRNDENLEHLQKQIESTTPFLPLQCNIFDEVEVRQSFEKTNSYFGKIDILLAMVGGINTSQTIAEIPLEEWNRMMKLNLTSTFLTVREMQRHLKGKTYGRIITIGAISGLTPPAGRGAYAASKAGVIALTKSLAEEVKGSGITANVIVPSILRTRANMAAMPDDDPMKWVSLEAVVSLMLHLCSDDGSAINGAILQLFGGV